MKRYLITYSRIQKVEYEAVVVASSEKAARRKFEQGDIEQEIPVAHETTDALPNQEPALTQIP